MKNKKLTIAAVKAFISALGEFEQRQLAEEILSNQGIVKGWSYEDIIKQAREDGYEPTKEQATEILDWISRKHDANIGINWEVISTYIDLYNDETPLEEFDEAMHGVNEPW